MHDNRIFSPTGNLSNDCGPAFDVNTVIAPFTSTMDTDLIAAARQVLW